MKRKQIEKIPVKKPGNLPDISGRKQVAAQFFQPYLILDLWSQSGVWLGRHVMDAQTGEYASYNVGNLWTGENLPNFLNCYYSIPSENSFCLAKSDRETAMTAIRMDWPCQNVYERIYTMESDYARDQREKKEWNRLQRLHNLMNRIPDPGREVYDWIGQTAVGTLQYAIYQKEGDFYHCTACQGDFDEKAAGVRMKHNLRAVCPLCGHELTVDKRYSERSVKTRLTMIQDVDETQGVERHFEVTIRWETARTVSLQELIRCMLHRIGNRSKYPYKIYYRQYGSWGLCWEEGNPMNLRWKSGHLYPEGIRGGLAGTAYEAWIDVFPQMAAMGVKADSGRLLVERSRCFVQTVECLSKGRFFRLLEEESETVSFQSGYSGGVLRIDGKNVEEVMGIRDRQKINRLRQENGGRDMLEWLQWADKTGKKISSDTMSWYGKNQISSHQYINSRASKYLSPEQLMHYLERQKAELGKKKIYSVLETYEDYLSMANHLGKNMADVMIYRPRELKRRHDELVEEYGKLREILRMERDKEEARKKAEEMRRKYPGSEEILAEIKPKYEYEGKDYLIAVPSNFFQITMEGMALHHCVGNTERYFDRILQHETYICFLRRKEEPEKAFYTLEVEPGGTIRQHRGMYDEEPGIEEIKPFLREWQQEIRRRMSRKDQEYARASAVKREQNLEELRQKKNTRVLEALMEDLMEVV